MILSWCDKLASVPTVGFTLDWHFATSNAILGALSPVLDRLIAGDKPTFSIGQQGDPFSTSFVTHEGFHYAFEPSKVVVSFQHRMKPKAVSGGPPIMEMLSHPLPYTELLPKASSRLIEATLLVPGCKTRKITRVGVVATTMIGLDEAPPGIGKFIKYIGQPWKRVVDTFSIQIVAVLADASGWTDRCVHTLIKPEDPDELLTVIFDWQRTFLSGQIIESDHLKRILSKAEEDSLDYFEDLAEGSRFDDELIRSAT